MFSRRYARRASTRRSAAANNPPVSTSVGMIVDDQLHTMPMKCSQGLQQAIDRGAEVVQGLDNDGINLVPGNGTKDRSQPWPRLCRSEIEISLTE